jgi:hypothetical protein
MDDRALIEGTIAELRASIERLAVERETINGRIREKTDMVHEWEQRLRQLSSENGSRGQPRLPKGEPKRRVQEYLAVHPEGAESIKEIADAVGIQFSTVRGALLNPKNQALFVEKEGRWRLKTPHENA